MRREKENFLEVLALSLLAAGALTFPIGMNAGNMVGYLSGDAARKVYEERTNYPKGSAAYQNLSSAINQLELQSRKIQWKVYGTGAFPFAAGAGLFGTLGFLSRREKRKLKAAGYS